jgi:methylthioribose-1-phosphate isomerase
MRTLIQVLVAAVLGGVAGSVIRHVVDQKDKEATGELVIATTTTPILAGTLAGLVAPKRGKVAVALIVSANVAANLKTEPVNAVIRQWKERQKTAETTG